MGLDKEANNIREIDKENKTEIEKKMEKKFEPKIEEVNFVNYRQPAEWDAHEAVWLAWPYDRELWQENLEKAQAEFVGLCLAIVDFDTQTGKFRGEKLNVLVPTSAVYQVASVALKGLPVSFFEIPYGDIWLRDTAPIFVRKENRLAAACFQFNGWGEKYRMPGDENVAHKIAQRVAQQSGAAQVLHSIVLEGGSVEVDGEGTCLSSRQCLLNPNRNPNLSPKEVEAKVCKALGAEKMIWVDEGLLNDHTDGHIDTIARFVAPGVVLCMEAQTADDPNHAALAAIAQALSTQVDSQNRRLRVGKIPSPGLVLDEDGQVMPASYLNFYIGNSTVVVPTYGSPWDQAAVEAIGAYFPTRRTVGLSAKAILTGGGAFHCISQQQPYGESLGETK